eukprot:7046012-Pyramimonas_sp.AAC.1
MDRHKKLGRMIPRVTGLRPKSVVPAAPAMLMAPSHMLESFNANGGKRTLKKRLQRSCAMVVM